MLIVDAYNLMHAAAGRGGKVTGLSLQQFCEVCRGMKITLVMDGVRKPGEPQVGCYETIGLKWAGRGCSADDAIVAMCKASSGRRDICVVTDDRQLQKRVVGLGSKTLSCRIFLRQMYTYQRNERRSRQPEAKGGVTLSAAETDFWLRAFGFLPHSPVDEMKSRDPRTGGEFPVRDGDELSDAEIEAIDMQAFLD